KILTKIYNKKTAQRIRIIYGGSANSKNAADYIFKAGMQGLLVGGASLDAKEFVKIVKLLTRF
ncbi:MAG: triose-phosphate isomerase, partial [Parcubacteria group bacterium CG11_big_fil_rev_8_21_14_0_20_39_14]